MYWNSRILTWLGCVLWFVGGSLNAQLQLPVDVGTSVNGFQDDFDGAALGSYWQISGMNVFTVSGGALHVSPASGDPNHLLYSGASYDKTIQEVLARIRIVTFGSGYWLPRLPKMP